MQAEYDPVLRYQKRFLALRPRFERTRCLLSCKPFIPLSRLCKQHISQKEEGPMKKYMVTLVLIGLASLIFSAPSWGAKYQQRLIQQQKRIWHGFNKGQLTRNETRRLMHEQHKIRRHIGLFWRDGHLTRKERHRLHRWLYKSDRHIWRLKHNRHYRNRYWPSDYRYGRHIDWHHRSAR